jgi:hypothetical protein
MANDPLTTTTVPRSLKLKLTADELQGLDLIAVGVLSLSLRENCGRGTKTSQSLVPNKPYATKSRISKVEFASGLSSSRKCRVFYAGAVSQSALIREGVRREGLRFENRLRLLKIYRRMCR